MIIQIYEIQTPLEADRCISLGIDRIGSVIFPANEWRQPLLREVIRLSEGTKTENSLIPLFSERDNLYRAMDYYRPHFVHFCDNLTDRQGCQRDLAATSDMQAQFKERFPEIRILRSIPVPVDHSLADFPTLQIARILEPLTDAFLADSWLGKEPVEGFIGITGRIANWDLSGMLSQQSAIPVILGGGLSPENVFDATTKVIPAGVDSCTHTNIVDSEGKPVRFKKDFSKVERFVKEACRAKVFLQEKRDTLKKRILKLREELKEREASLPPHSIRPHQILAIEALEDEILTLEGEIRMYKHIPE